MYSLPKSVLIQFVGSHSSRRQRIALTLKGVHDEPVMAVGEQVVMPQAEVDVHGKAVNPYEDVREMHWWKYVGVALQADMKHDKMVDQMVDAGKAKAVAMGSYLSFAGGLTPVVQLAVVTAIVPGVMLHALCSSERDMDRMFSVWDGVLRSVFGCAKYGMNEGAVSIGSWLAVVSFGGSEDRYSVLRASGDLEARRGHWGEKGD